MVSKVTELSPVLVEVEVEVPWDDVAKGLEESYARLQKSAKLRGFRPGKVPRNVIKQMFSQQVKGEVTQQLVERGIVAAVETHSLSAVAVPSVDAKPFEDGKPLAFTAKIEVRPKVEAVELSKLEIERPSGEVKDADVDREVERLRLENAEVRVPDPPRPSKKGDILTVDYVVTIDGETKDDLAATDRPIEVGSDRLLPEFVEGLVGVSVGETKPLEVKFAEDHGREDLRGKTGVFAITVKELRERNLPEIDDAFAKDCGEFATMLELRLDLRKKLEEVAKRRVESELREKVVDKLVDTNPVPVPPSLIEQQEQAMMREFASFLRMAGGDIPMTDELHKTMHERAERKVRAAILFGEIAKKESLTVTSEDVDKKLGEIAERTGKHIAKIRVEYQGDRKEQLESQILEGKILDYLLSQARISDAPAAGAEEKAG